MMDLIAAILESMPGGAVLVDSKGNVVSVNSRFQGWMGESGAADRGESWRSLAARLFEPVGEEARMLRRGGRLFRVAEHPLPAGEVLMFVDDITAQEEKSAARRRLLSIGSHDIRSPMANARVYASLLLSPQSSHDERTRGHLKVILRNTDKAISLLQEFIDSWMDELGMLLPLEASDQPLAPLIQEALERCRSSADEKGLQLEASLPPIDVSGSVDRGRFVHAVAALIEHGTKRSQSGGTLQLDARVASGRLRVAVTDGGPGPTADELESYFDRDRSLALEGVLGARFRLSLAAAEIRVHHGEPGIQLIPEGGATFFFLLPLC